MGRFPQAHAGQRGRQRDHGDRQRRDDRADRDRQDRRKSRSGWRAWRRRGRKNVVNLLQAPPPPEPRQILLQVKFAAIDRVALSQIGFNLFSTNDKLIGAVSTQQFPSPRFSQLTDTGGGRVRLR